MATKDPNSRLTEGSLNSPSYPSDNGITDPRGSAGVTASGVTPGADVGRRDDETPGEKIGRFFRRAMDRLSGHDDEELRRRNERNERDERNLRDRESQERSRSGERSDRVGSARHERGQSEWSGLGGSSDERNLGYGGSASSDIGGGDERFRSGSGSVAYGHGQGSHAPSFENRGGQSSAQRSLGRSPSESYGLGEIPSERPIGSDRGFQGDQGRDDWNRGEWNRGEPNRGHERWGDRNAQSAAAGASTSYAGAGASFGFGRDERRAGEWSEIARDRDQGQGRRFWQREPLAARDVMTRNPKTVTRQSALREAAVIMRDENCGVVPVVDGAGRLEGILTDRDMVVRGLVSETGAARRIEDVMTDDVSAVTEDEPLTSVLDLMGRKQVRRVPVVDRNDRLLGIISMADIANRADYDEDLQDAFERISSRRSFWSLFS